MSNEDSPNGTKYIIQTLPSPLSNTKQKYKLATTSRTTKKLKVIKKHLTLNQVQKVANNLLRCSQ